MPFSFEVIRERIDRIADSVIAGGGVVQAMRMGAPAAEEQVAEAERRLGAELPAGFRQVLLRCSGEFDFRWFLDEDAELPSPYGDIFRGELGWSLARLPEIDEGRRNWVKEVFSNPDNEYDKVWQNKLAFMEVGNGDYLALDLGEDDGPVVYLSHADGKGHGFVLGRNFIDFLERGSRIGFVGPEDFQWVIFADSGHGGLNAEGHEAAGFRKLMGFEP
ncbi:SMI1/KNR4 family protein [Saccharibacillus alkalitolerans]|uniref:SMI1/KNR4 family protein n=1 Tax=Saccharibacillus alkalitolerans TaxID=2705290 RepID=A0ABX0F434_9BACL|nr:SMI1/KNR4 family protein [Saccharibacillus alkalitolerans]NGZ75726.1 SMI1/KNR4 family protein [Saccharibacillus alkalitolerans]